MTWNIHFTQKTPQNTTEIIEQILKNRHLSTDSSSISRFISPPYPKISQIIADLKLDKKRLKQVLLKIKTASDKNQPIIIYSDYDVDGICAVSYLYQAIKFLHSQVNYFIPHRQKHGYGLSDIALKEIKKKYNFTNKPLIIAVDNGITATKIISKNQPYFDFIVIDHHQKPKKIPSVPILHNSSVCAATLSWLVSCILTKRRFPLDLVSIATLCDQMSLSSFINRALVIHGLKEIPQTNRPGLAALFKITKIDPASPINAYHVNFLIGPRLNAAGRLDSAEISLKLLIETNPSQAAKLAQKLDQLNQMRQKLTQDAFSLSLSQIKPDKPGIIVVSHPQFHEGVLGLIAAKLTEKFKRPSLVIQSTKTKAKGSAL